MRAGTSQEEKLEVTKKGDDNGELWQREGLSSSCSICMIVGLVWGFMVVRNLKNRRYMTLQGHCLIMGFAVSHAFKSYLTPNTLRFQEKNYNMNSWRNITRLSNNPTFLIVVLGLPTLRVQGVGRGAASCQTWLKMGDANVPTDFKCPFQPFFCSLHFRVLPDTNTKKNIL